MRKLTDIANNLPLITVCCATKDALEKAKLVAVSAGAILNYATYTGVSKLEVVTFFGKTTSVVFAIPKSHPARKQLKALDKVADKVALLRGLAMDVSAKPMEQLKAEAIATNAHVKATWQAATL